MKRVFASTAPVILGVLSTGVLAHAQERRLETYGDWTLSCVVASGSGTVKSCGLVQVETSGKQNPVSQVGIGRYATSDPLKFSIEIPANVWLPTGITMLLDGRQPPITPTFKWCTASRCYADADISDAEIKRLRAQKGQGQISYRNAQQGDISIPIVNRHPIGTPDRHPKGTPPSYVLSD
jgi:invasion protein IalB